MSLILHSNGFIKKNSRRKRGSKFIFKLIIFIVLGSLLVGFIANLMINKKNEKLIIENNKYITIDNKKNYYNIQGKDAPTIIFESSSGMGISQWDAVRKLLEDELGIKSFAYERDGFGLSDFSQVKTPEEQAKELKLILRKVALNGPYILVGEEYGSLVMTNFAKLYPELVEGIILVSPINEKELGNTSYYKHFSKDKLKRKLDITGSYLGLNHLVHKFIGLDSPEGLNEMLDETEYNNYKILRPTTNFNKAYYSELENILNQSSKSQVDGMFKNIPLAIVTNNTTKKEQEALKVLGSEDKTKILDSGVDSKIISLEKPELILQSVDYILGNIPLKENSNP